MRMYVSSSMDAVLLLTVWRRQNS